MQPSRIFAVGKIVLWLNNESLNKFDIWLSSQVLIRNIAVV